MALTDEIRRIVEEYLNPRINQLPPLVPEEGDFLPFWSKRRGITGRLSAAALNPALPTAAVATNFEWIPNRKDINGDPWPYSLNDVVTRGNNWYQSKVVNNLNTPGSDDTWELMTKSFSGGFWKAGLYTDPQPWVFYTDAEGFTDIYILTDPERPFRSANFVTELNAGQWVSISGGRIKIDEVDTSVSPIVLDVKHDTQRWFRGSVNIDGPRSWVLLDDENAVEMKFMFVMSGLFPQTLPANFRMPDVKFQIENNTWTPSNIGEYEAVINSRGDGTYGLKIFGPFGGGGNLMPAIFDNVIALNGTILDGPRSYFDPENDPENNPPPRVLNPQIVGDQYPGTLLEIQFDFESPMGYAPGAHEYQWYEENEDGTNRQAKSGETGLTYLKTVDDIGKALSADIVAVQVANAPANGNPRSEPVSTPRILIQEFVEEVLPVLDLDAYYDHVADAVNYDEGTFSIPDTGVAGGANSWTSPAEVRRPTFVEADPSLSFDDAIDEQYIAAPIINFNAKGSFGSRTWEVVGVFEIPNTLATNNNEYTVWSIGTQVLMQIEGTKVEVVSSGTVVFSKDLVANTKYRFRLRSDLVNSLVELRLQLNYDEESGTYEFDETQVGNSGTAWTNAQMLIGARNPTGPTRGFVGKQWVLGFLVQVHLDPAKVVELWRNLNSR